MAFGTTMVDVSMKNINNRNIISVIDDIEKMPMALVLRFIIAFYTD